MQFLLNLEFMMKVKLLNIFLILLLSLVLLPQYAEAQRRIIPVDKIAATGKSVQDFVPAGWTVEQQFEGALTADHNPAIVVSLLEDLPAEVNGVPNERFRALLILEQDGNGKLRRLAVAPTVLRDTTAFGMLGGPAGGQPEITISTRVLAINHLWGSREATNQTLKFRYDGELQRFVLIGAERQDFDRLEGNSTHISSNYLTGWQIIEKFKGDKRISQVKKKLPAGKRYLEDIDYEKE